MSPDFRESYPHYFFDAVPYFSDFIPALFYYGYAPTVSIAANISIQSGAQIITKYAPF